MKQIPVGFVSALAGGVIWIAGPVWAQHQHPAPGAHQPAAAVQAAPGEQVLKVGKNAEVEFGVETTVGELKLKPGRYRIQHRVDGSDHFVHFTEVTKEQPYSKSGGGLAKGEPGEIKCRLEPLNKKVSTTTVYRRLEGDGARLIKVLIGGENVAHVF